MRSKKTVSLVLALMLVLGAMFVVPASAEAKEQIKVLLSKEYSKIKLLPGEDDIYLVSDRQETEGLYSSDGHWITECQWNSISSFDDNGFSLVNKGGKCGVIDRNGNLCIAAEWNYVILDSGIATVCKNGLWGICDMRNNILLEPQMSSISEFHEGYSLFYKNDKYGFVATNGNIISEAVWSDADYFSDGLAAVKDDSGKWGYIDETGTLVIPCSYDNASAFINSVGWVETDGKAMPINKSGSVLNAIRLAPTYDCLGRLNPVIFSGSQKKVACVKLYGEDGYCYIDNNFNVLSESIYLYSVDVTEKDYAVVMVGTKYTVLKVTYNNGQPAVNSMLLRKGYAKVRDFDGTVLFEADRRLYNIDGVDIFGFNFDKVTYNYDNSGFATAVKDGKYACSKFGGEKLSDLSDYKLSFVSEGVYIAVDEGKDAYFCSSLTEKLPSTANYKNAYVKDDFVYVMNGDKKWGVCNKNGNEVIAPAYDKLYNVTEDMLKYKNNGKYGFINLETKAVIEAKFVNVSDFRGGFAWVTEKVLTGTIDKDGKYVIKPEYWAYEDDTGFGCNEFSHGVTSVKTKFNGGYEIVNTSGQRLTDNVYDYVGEFSESGVAVFCDGIWLTDNIEYFNAGLIKIVYEEEKNPVSIATDVTSVTVVKGSSKVITPTLSPENASDKTVIYTSANPDVATVTSVGRIEGIKAGNTVVSVKSAADESVVTSVSVTVTDATLHGGAELIAEDQWEDQLWLADVVIEKLAELGTVKNASQITYGDLLAVNEIVIPFIPDKGEIYHIPDIIACFTNLISFKIGYDKIEMDESINNNDIYQDRYWYEPSGIFTPLLGGMPAAADVLPYLSVVDITGTYGNEYDENIIRNNSSGIPDTKLYKTIGIKSRSGDNTLYSSFDWGGKGIADLTGLSLFNISSYYGYIDLRSNDISDISELEKLNLSGVTVMLDGNRLDLENETTKSVIKTLTDAGCTVTTKNQNNMQVLWKTDKNRNSYYYYEPDTQFEIINQEPSCYSSYSGLTCNGDMSRLTVLSSDKNIAFAEIENDSRRGLYNLVCTGYAAGEATVSLCYDGVSIWDISVTVTDEHIPAPINIYYEVSEYNPVYASLHLNNWYSIVYYRLKGEENWKVPPRPQGTHIGVTENGTYEFMYQNEYGLSSDIATLEITGIKKAITTSQIPDENLYNALRNYSSLYEEKKFTYFSNTYKDIHDLTGLSLLDFSELSYSMDLSYNRISDITELGKLGLKNISVNLSYNKLDLEDEATKATLKTLRSAGCWVVTSNQNYSGTSVKFDSSSVSLIYDTGFQPTVGYMVYPASAMDYITLSVEDTSIAGIRRIENQLIYLSSCNISGKTTLNAYYKGRIFASADITAFNSNNPPAPKISVFQNNGGTVDCCYIACIKNFSNVSAVIYRKQGETEWNNFISIYAMQTLGEAGIYEFRCLTNTQTNSPAVYSEIAVVHITEKDNIAYSYQEGGTACVLGYTGTQPHADIVIPDEIEGVRVTSIQNSAFIYVKSVVVPNTVTSIGYDAFGHSVTDITIPASVYLFNEDSLPEIERITIHTQKNAPILNNPMIQNHKYIVDLSAELSDINEDGTIDIRDMVRLKKGIVTQDNSISRNTADHNFDGKINAVDLVALKRYFIAWK